MDVTGEYGEQKEAAVDQEVESYTAEHHDRKGREEDVDDGEDDAVHESFHCRGNSTS